MGTDMHVMIEVKHGDEPWKPIGGAPQAFAAPRNYAMFSVLADVRNGAGRHEKVWQEPHVHEHDGHKVDIPGWWYDPEDGGHEKLAFISEPRGVPEDASVAWLANVLMWEVKSSTVDTTWFTPQELLEGPWDQRVIRYGLISEADYITLLETGKTPQTHAAGAAGEGVRIVSEQEYGEGIRGEHMTMVNATWVEPSVREMVAGFLEMVEEIESSKPSESKVRFMVLFES